MNKISFLIAAPIWLALAIWAINRNMGSDSVQQPDNTSMAPEPSDRSLPASFVQGETPDDAVEPDDYGAAISTFREAVVTRDSDDLSLPTGNPRLQSEPIDENWAPQMESVMWSTISTIGEILEVECRTAICRALVVPSDSESSDVVRNRVLRDSFRSIIMSSDGRLDQARFGFFGTGDGRSGIAIELLGPPLEAGTEHSASVREHG